MHGRSAQTSEQAARNERPSDHMPFNTWPWGYHCCPCVVRCWRLADLRSGPCLILGLSLEGEVSCLNHLACGRIAWNRVKSSVRSLRSRLRRSGAIRVRLQLAEEARDLALFNLAIDSKLRGCDVVRVGVEDVLLSGTLRSRASVVQKKTGKPVTFEITDQTRLAIQGWLPHLGGRQRGPLFPSPHKPEA